MSFDYGITLLFDTLKVRKLAAHWWGSQRHFCVRMSYSWADRPQQK